MGASWYSAETFHGYEVIELDDFSDARDSGVFLRSPDGERTRIYRAAWSETVLPDGHVLYKYTATNKVEESEEVKGHTLLVTFENGGFIEISGDRSNASDLKKFNTPVDEVLLV